ncbi:MAG: hypothetical protein RIC93_01035, partial [Alphaproteobacteria bacterium]
MRLNFMVALRLLRRPLARQASLASRATADAAGPDGPGRPFERQNAGSTDSTFSLVTTVSGIGSRSLTS